MENPSPPSVHSSSGQHSNLYFVLLLPALLKSPLALPEAGTLHIVLTPLSCPITKGDAALGAPNIMIILILIIVVSSLWTPSHWLSLKSNGYNFPGRSPVSTPHLPTASQHYQLTYWPRGLPIGCKPLKFSFYQCFSVCNPKRFSTQRVFRVFSGKDSSKAGWRQKHRLTHSAF